MIGFSQIGDIINTIVKKEYSKEIVAFQAKEYVINNILQVNEEPIRFVVDPLSGAESGELTTLYYNCEEQNKEGLLLAFYGSFWNDAGVVYTGYGFKNLNKKEALEFLTKIQLAIDSNSKYLKDSKDNNIVLKYNDVDIDAISFYLRSSWWKAKLSISRNRIVARDTLSATLTDIRKTTPQLNDKEYDQQKDP